MTRKVIIGKTEKEKDDVTVEFIYKGEIVAIVNVFASGSVFVDEGWRIVNNKTYFFIFNDDDTQNHTTIA